MTYNPAVRGKHAGTHQDQYRTAKQQRLDAASEIDDALTDLCTCGYVVPHFPCDHEEAPPFPTQQ